MILSWFKISQLDPYDSTIDLLDHLESYKIFMMIQGTVNALLYLAFLATLWKATRVWYSELEPKSIHSFGQLEKLLMAYFNTN